LIGYFDFVIYKIGLLFNLDFKLLLLTNVLRSNRFDFVHAIEIQGAGYLYLKLPASLQKNNSLILTNWGSDIFYFQKDPLHNSKLSEIIKLASFYSAECERDYKLLKNYDFKGNLLPCIPNGGGFSDKLFKSIRDKTSDRNLILCKGYGGKFGRLDISICAIENILKKYPSFNVFFYSVTKDVEKQVTHLARKYHSRVSYVTISKSISHELLLKKFAEARVYLACSESDGISTSFLEAVVSGAYAIQTKTSCADEWEDKGIICSVVDLDVNEVTRELEKVINDTSLLNKAQRVNFNVTKAILSESTISQIAHKFYDVIQNKP
jgi:hypothetical protein